MDFFNADNRGLTLSELHSSLYMVSNKYTSAVIIVMSITLHMHECEWGECMAYMYLDDLKPYNLIIILLQKMSSFLRVQQMSTEDIITQFYKDMLSLQVSIR